MYRDNEGWTPLHEVCLQGRLAVIQALVKTEKETGNFSAMLKATTDDRTKQYRRSTPLFFATITNRPGCVEFLVKQAGSPRCNDKYGDTPIHAACLLGHLTIVSILLNAGVDIKQRESTHNAMPLLKAASMGKVKVIEFLLHKGADLRARNVQDCNALGLAKRYHPEENEAVRFIERWIAKLGNEPKKQTARETPAIEGLEMETSGPERPETVDSGTGVLAPGVQGIRAQEIEAPRIGTPKTGTLLSINR